jgi:hypothetical protein
VSLSSAVALRGSLLACVVAFGMALPPAAQAQTQSETESQPRAVSGVVLRGLDKITARVSTFTAPLDQEIEFGTLRITARACRKRPPEEPPEVAAFLEIAEERPGEDTRVDLFRGWMFASSPALSALEHPVYDVWVIDCSTSEADKDAPPSEKSAE